jgi:hypothetical protein
MRALFVVGDLRAEEAAREGMKGIARNSHSAPALHRDEHRAGVWTVMRARGPDNRLAVFLIFLIGLKHLSSLRCSGEFLMG